VITIIKKNGIITLRLY